MVKLYANGLFFQEAAENTLNEQLARIKKNLPSLIIIDGGQGEGKTTLGIHFLDFFNKKKGLPECSLKITDHPQIGLGGKEFIKNFNACRDKKLPAIVYDEAGDFSKRGAISRFNNMINRRFETFRSSKIIVILCLPNFNALDNHLFDLKVPRVLFHCRERETTISYGNYSAYSYARMGWLRYWHGKLPIAIRYQAYNKTYPNYYGHFKNLEPERSNSLAKLSDFGKDKESILSEIKMEGLIGYSDLAQRVGRSIIWVRKVVSELKIKEARIINRAKYFPGETIDRIFDYIDNRQDGPGRPRVNP